MSGGKHSNFDKMQIFYSAFIIYVFQILFVLFCVLNSIYGRRYPEDSYYGRGYYDREDQEGKIKNALELLEHEPQWVSNWPDASVKLGQVSGVALDASGNVLVFHRGSKVWDANTFYERNVYRYISEPPIPQPTIFVFNETGGLVDMWGQNIFHMPHGITMDSEGNVWLTDVARHQVFKFAPSQREQPALVLGEKFVPGDDDWHFCKPSAVAVLSSGEFFVADGYCNTRIIKFAADGSRILQWGKGSGNSPFVFNVPHALTLAEDRGQVCVADRERGRVACFRADNGTYVAGFSSWLIGPRLFSVSYAPVHGGRLYIVNGPSLGGLPVRGYVVDFTSGRLIQTFGPGGDFSNPHDVIVTPDGSEVYVAELNPFKVYKFTDDQLRNESKKERSNATVPAKPTATVELVGAGRSRVEEGGGWWRGAAGGAAGAGAAALLLLAALALLKARNRGRKGAPRRRWDYGPGEFKLRRLLARRRFTRVRSDDSDEEPAPMLPPPTA